MRKPCTRLSFPALVDEKTAEVLPKPRYANDRGLTFTATPKVDGYRIELGGSIHKYARNGVHNADQFTAAEVLAALIEWVEHYGIDPFTSTLHNVEFGVDISLSFPVARVLDNLICYKGKPFHPDRKHGPYYWQCLFGQYAVKIYDKGAEFRERVPRLPPNLLRVEVKVLKMEYLHKRGVGIKTLADLLTTVHYPTLGALLVETFTDILFDDSTVNPATLKRKDWEVLINGRNPKFWTIPKGLPNNEYTAVKKKRQRNEERFRALLDQHRTGPNWQNQIAGLIGQTWERLSHITPELATAIGETLAGWQLAERVEKCPLLTGLAEKTPARETSAVSIEKCPFLTGVAGGPETGKMSPFDHLYLVSERDVTGEPTIPATLDRETVETVSVYCPVTGVKLHQLRPRQRFVSGGMLARDAGLLAEVSGRYGQYAKGSKETQPVRAAHNVRNTYHNPGNNLKRRIGRVHRQPVLFDVDSALRLTAGHRAALNR